MNSCINQTSNKNVGIANLTCVNRTQQLVRRRFGLDRFTVVHLIFKRNIQHLTGSDNSLPKNSFEMVKLAI